MSILSAHIRQLPLFIIVIVVVVAVRRQPASIFVQHFGIFLVGLLFLLYIFVGSVYLPFLGAIHLSVGFILYLFRVANMDGPGRGGKFAKGSPKI